MKKETIRSDARSVSNSWQFLCCRAILVIHSRGPSYDDAADDDDDDDDVLFARFPFNHAITII